MRKILTVILALVLVIGLFGCDETTKTTTEPEADETQNVALIETESVAEEIEEETETAAIETNPMLKNFVYPLPSTININNLTNCTLSVVIMNDDVFLKNETLSGWQMRVEVCDYERFDPEDIANLDVDKTFVINGHDVKVNDIERRDTCVIINGGVGNGGYELVVNETGEYHSLVYGMKTYYDVGEIVLDISHNVVYINASDPDVGEIVGTIDDLVHDVGEAKCFGTPHDTTIVVENGVVVELRRGETKYLNCSD